MELKNVVSSKRLSDQSIELVVTDPSTGGKTTKHFADIRGGISWPTALSPALAIIVGEEYQGSSTPGESESRLPGRRTVITEVISESLNLETDFYSPLVEISAKLSCEVFYFGLPEGADLYDYGYFVDFERFRSRCNSRVSLRQAFDSKDFLLGVIRIRQDVDRKGLDIPSKTTVFRELQNLTKENIQDSPEVSLYATNALGHVIGAFVRSPPINYKFTSRKRAALNWRAV
jgi:hypothetical protein